MTRTRSEWPPAGPENTPKWSESTAPIKFSNFRGHAKHQFLRARKKMIFECHIEISFANICGKYHQIQNCRNSEKRINFPTFEIKEK